MKCKLWMVNCKQFTVHYSTEASMCKLVCFYDRVVTRCDLVVTRCDLVVTRYEIRCASRNYEIVSRNYEIASRNYEIVKHTTWHILASVPIYLNCFVWNLNHQSKPLKPIKMGSIECNKAKRLLNATSGRPWRPTDVPVFNFSSGISGKRQKITILM